MITIYNNHLYIITDAITMFERNNVIKEKNIYKVIIVYLKGIINMITVHGRFVFGMWEK